MDEVRYVIALLLVSAIPAAIVFWLLAHPLVRFWRLIGAPVSYAILCTAAASVMVGMFLLRSRLLATDYGTNRPLAAGGLVCLAFAGWLLGRLRRHLTVRTLVGVPEIAPGSGGELLTGGVYGKVRHPRYLQMTIALAGYALIANYPAVYGALLFWCTGIYLVVLLEERELRERFGDAYRDYCRRVPRFVPRFRERTGR
jgi:protein-S-isoprenylcysteine O-methyltransferase Ste14